MALVNDNAVILFFIVFQEEDIMENIKGAV